MSSRSNGVTYWVFSSCDQVARDLVALGLDRLHVRLRDGRVRVARGSGSRRAARPRARSRRRWAKRCVELGRAAGTRLRRIARHCLPDVASAARSGTRQASASTTSDWKCASTSRSDWGHEWTFLDEDRHGRPPLHALDENSILGTDLCCRTRATRRSRPRSASSAHEVVEEAIRSDSGARRGELARSRSSGGRA